MEKKNTPLTEEEKIRKQRLSTRLFAVLVGIDILLVAYLVYEMISIFTMNKNGSNSSVESAAALLSWFRTII